MSTPTIFAVASGAGRAAISVLRISGPNAGEAVRLLSGPLPPPRYARLSALKDPESHEILDRGLVLWFPGPASLTGEDMAELHLHGGRAVAAAIVAAISKMPDFRPAEPGEFSRRAFHNGKFDLTAAEGIADLIEAETEAQRRQAMRQLEGAFGKLVESWRERLVKALAYVEAAIDFAEDDPAVAKGEWRREIAAVAEGIGEHLDDQHRGERLRDGFEVAILGPPNAGKSSLLNKLAGREAAIVSRQAGTTRDIIEVHLDLGGLPVILADTAGLRESKDEVESEGVRRALVRAEAADLKLAVIDASSDAQIDSETKRIIDARSIVVANKRDLLADGDGHLENILALAPRSLAVSAKSGEGIAELLAAIEEAARESIGGFGAAPITRIRHRVLLQECAAALDRFENAKPSELAAEDLRLATRALGRITGRVDVDDILDVIFRDFCIGK